MNEEHSGKRITRQKSELGKIHSSIQDKEKFSTHSLLKAGHWDFPATEAELVNMAAAILVKVI